MTRVAFLALSFLLHACAGTPSTPSDDANGPDRGPRGDVVVREGVEYRGDVAVMESFPVQLVGNVTITNRGNQTKAVWFPDGCVALLRVYTADGSEPAWDQGNEVACTMAIVAMELAPGESRQVKTPTASGYDILGDRLPDGAYRIGIYLRPGNGVVEIEAGTTDLAIPR